MLLLFLGIQLRPGHWRALFQKLKKLLLGVWIATAPRHYSNARFNVETGDCKTCRSPIQPFETYAIPAPDQNLWNNSNASCSSQIAVWLAGNVEDSRLHGCVHFLALKQIWNRSLYILQHELDMMSADVGTISWFNCSRWVLQLMLTLRFEAVRHQAVALQAPGRYPENAFEPTKFRSEVLHMPGAWWQCWRIRRETWIARGILRSRWWKDRFLRWLQVRRCRLLRAL